MPPAYGRAESAVWHAAHPISLDRYSPRARSSGSGPGASRALHASSATATQQSDRAVIVRCPDDIAGEDRGAGAIDDAVRLLII
jgi:hypothetical protein